MREDAPPAAARARQHVLDVRLLCAYLTDVGVFEETARLEITIETNPSSNLTVGD